MVLEGLLLSIDFVFISVNQEKHIQDNVTDARVVASMKCDLHG